MEWVAVVFRPEVLDMAVATKSQYWTTRTNGEDPTDPDSEHHNEAWTSTGSGGSASGDYWLIDGTNYLTISPSTNDLTLFVGIFYSDSTDLPADGTTLMRLTNATHQVQVQSDGTATGLKLVGATTVAVSGILDLTQAEDDPFITLLRLTLDSAGNAKLYVQEAMEDELGDDASYSVVGASGSWSGAQEIKWGSNSGKPSGARLTEHIMGHSILMNWLIRASINLL